MDAVTDCGHTHGLSVQSTAGVRSLVLARYSFQPVISAMARLVRLFNLVNPHIDCALRIAQVECGGGVAAGPRCAA